MPRHSILSSLLVFITLVSKEGFAFAPSFLRSHSDSGVEPSRRRCSRWIRVESSIQGQEVGEVSVVAPSLAGNDSFTSPPQSAVAAEFGQVVKLKPMSGSSSSSSSRSSDFLVSPSSSVSSSTSSSSADVETMLQRRRRINLGTAVAAVALALMNYAWQFTHPYNPLQLLVQMQTTSSDLSVIGSNGRPTLVDFWAPWCENCKLQAATLNQVHQEYAGKVNFVMINGDDQSPRIWGAIETFGVDVVPHLALVNGDGEVETALVGIVPKHVIEADLDSLLSSSSSSNTQPGKKSDNNQHELPYMMLDTFSSRPEQRKLHFDKVE